MLIRVCTALTCLLFLMNGCDSKSGSKPATPSSTPSSTSAQPTNSAESAMTPAAGETAGEKTASKPVTDVCALLEKSEIATVQGQPINEAKRSERAGGGRFLISQCFYVAAVFDRSVSLEITERDPKNPDKNAVQNYWKATFHEPTRAKKGEREERSSEPRVVTGLGDEAYWLGNEKAGAVHALKNDKIVRISIGGPSKLEEKIEKSKTLAAAVLRRLD